jgi:hypothetical protein
MTYDFEAFSTAIRMCLITVDRYLRCSVYKTGLLEYCDLYHEISICGDMPISGVY